LQTIQHTKSKKKKKKKKKRKKRGSARCFPNQEGEGFLSPLTP